jgi:hypothetical protein
MGGATTNQLPPFGHAISGATGALLALTITYPLDMLVGSIFNMMLDLLSIIDALFKTFSLTNLE